MAQAIAMTPTQMTALLGDWRGNDIMEDLVVEHPYYWSFVPGEPDGEGSGSHPTCWIDYTHTDGHTYRVTLDAPFGEEIGEEIVSVEVM